MTPQYSKAVDPVILLVLGLLDRIGRTTAGSYREERDKVLQAFREAEAQIGSAESWKYTKYALACWVDEMLIAAPWDGRQEWNNNSLEFDFFNTQIRATNFFQQAKEADKLSTSDAIEVFYLCVILGFRGLYGAKQEESAFLADRMDLPQSIEEWSKHISRRIKFFKPPPPDVKKTPVAGAPPLMGRFLLVGSLLVCSMMTAVFVVVGFMKILPDLQRMYP